MSSVRMQYSDDAHGNPSSWDEKSTGDEGDYSARPVWTRLGQCIRREYTFESSSACRRDVYALVGEVTR